MNDHHDPILKIEDLTVAYRQGGERLEAARDISLAIPPGQTCGLVGESGSGKTTLALSVMRYLPEEGRVREGRILFAGRDLRQTSPAEMRDIWGNELTLMPQNPLSSLNPSLRLGEQATEILRHHRGLGRSEARERVLSLFERVRLRDPERVFDSYPHQLSGGMLQRVLLAMAISTEPRLLILDEPTSSLDVTTQAAILDLLRELIAERDVAVLYITHNLGVVAQISDRVVVMYAGEFSEDAPTGRIFDRPLHPYTQGLLDSVPLLGQNKSEVQLRPIEGRIPELDDLPEGCIFRPRCPLAIEVCYEVPPLYDAGPNRRSRCHRWEEIEAGEVSAHQPAPAVELPPVTEEGETTLCMEDVKVYYTDRRSLLGLLRGRDRSRVEAVDGVSMEIAERRTLGLVGESGSGKTTLARAIVGLTTRDAGIIELDGIELPPGLAGRDRDMQRRLQIVFQNPEEALNPYLSVREALRRPLEHLLGLSPEEAEERVVDLLEAVHLTASYADRLPGQLSGGEKQRVAVARAFAPNPELLIADEPVSSLDVSVQASILNLFNELQAEHDISVLFISHDLAVVGYLADWIAVIYEGKLVEIGPSQAVFRPPYHPYTETLLASVPLIDPEAVQRKIRIEELALEEEEGCPFGARCPRKRPEVCEGEEPGWWEDEETGKRIACHISMEDLRSEQEPAYEFKTRRPTQVR